MKKNMKFKGLLSYTASCIAELVTPPNPNVRDNAHALKKFGGVEILVEALKHHGDSEDLFEMISKTLDKCACDSNMISHLAKSGAASALLKPVNTHPDYGEARVVAVGLVRKLATVEETLDCLVSQGVTQSIVGVIGTASKLNQYEVDSTMLCDSSTTLSRLVNNPAAVSSLNNNQDIKTIIGVIESSAAQDRRIASRFLQPVFHVLKSISRTEEGLAILKSQNCVDSLVGVMEANPNNTSLLKVGASVLDSLVSVTDLNTALATLANSGALGQTKKLAAAMVGNLALVGDNMETINNAGGLQSLLAVLDAEQEDGLVEASSRALGRLCTSISNLEAFLSSDGIAKLLHILRNNADKDGIVAAVDGALTRIAHFYQGAVAISSSDGLETVVWALECHPEFVLAPSAALRLFIMMMKTLGAKGATLLSQKGILSHVTKAALVRPENEVLAFLVAQVFSSMIKLIGCTRDAVDVGIIEIAIAALNCFPSMNDTATQLLELLYSLTFEKSFRDRMIEVGVVGPALRSAKANLFSVPLQRAVVRLLERLANESLLTSAIRNVQEQANKMSSSGIAKNDEAAFNECVLSLMTVEYYSKIPKCNSMILSLGAPAAVMKFVNAVAQSRKEDLHDFQERLLSSSLKCLNAVACSNKRRTRSRVCELAASSLSNLLKKFAEYPDALAEAAHVVHSLSELSGNIIQLHSVSIVKNLIGASKSNPSHTLLQSWSAKALQKLASESKFADYIVRAGAVRVYLSITSSNDLDEKKFTSAKCAADVFDLVGALAHYASAKTQLNKQQGVLDSMLETLHRFSWNTAVVVAAKAPIASLIDEKFVDDIFDPQNAHEISLSLLKTQYASSSCLIEKLAKAPGSVATNAFVETLSTISNAFESMQRGVAAANGLAWLGEGLYLVVGEQAAEETKDQSKVCLPQELAHVLVKSLADHAGKHLNLASSIMQCIGALARHTAILDALLNVGVVQAIVSVLQKLAHEDVAMISGLKALAEISKGSIRGAGMITSCGGIDLMKSELGQLENVDKAASIKDGKIERSCALYKLIAAICQSEDDTSMQSIFDAGVVTIMMDALRHHMQAANSSLRVRDSAISALSYMSSSEANCRFLCQDTEGSVTDAIVAILEEERKDCSPIIVGTLQLLGDLVCIPENVSILKQIGVDNAILNAMSRYPTHAAILLTAADTINPMVSSADVKEVVSSLQSQLPLIRSGDSRIANNASPLLWKLANLFIVKDIVYQGDSIDVDITSLAELLLSALDAGQALTDSDVRSMFKGACVAAISRFCHVPPLDDDQLSQLCNSVVGTLKEDLQNSVASTNAELSNLIWSTTSCGIMSENRRAAECIAREDQAFINTILKLLDLAANDRFLAFACLLFAKNMCVVDAKGTSNGRGIEAIVSIIRQHFKAPGVVLEGVSILGILCENYPSAPIIVEGGCTLLFDVLDKCFKHGSIVASWDDDSNKVGSVGDASVSRIVFQTMNALKICVSAMPSHRSALSQHKSLLTLKSVAVGSLADEEILTLSAEVFTTAASIDGNDGKETRALMCGADLAIPKLIMTALGSHPEFLSFTAAALRLLELLLKDENCCQTIDFAYLAEIVEDIITVHGGTSDIGLKAISLRDGESMSHKATPEAVIETLRTYASYVPHMPERPDLASHVLKYSKDLAQFSNTPDLADLILADNGVDAIISCLKLVSELSDFDEKESILSNSSEALSNVENTRVGYKASTNPTAVTAMLDNLRNNMKFGKLCEYSLNCLLTLSKNANNLAEIEKQGGLELILESLKTHGGNANVKRHAVELCKYLASDPNVAKKMAKLDMIEVLLGNIATTGESIDSLVDSLDTLKAISLAANDSLSRIRAANGIGTVITAIRTNSTSPDVCCSGLALLSKLGEQVGFVDDLEASGGVDVILSLMTTHAFDERVQGSVVLSHVASKETILSLLQDIEKAQTDGNVSEISTLLNNLANYMQVEGLHAPQLELIGPVMERVYSTMQAFPDSDAISNSGLRVLAELAKFDYENTVAKALQDEGQLMKAMDILKNDSMNASRVLPALALIDACANDETVSKALVNDGLVNALVSAFRNNTSNTSVQLKALSTLSSICKSMPSCEEFVEMGGISAFLEMLQIANMNGTNAAAKKILDSFIDLCSPDLDRTRDACKTFGESFLSHPKGVVTVEDSTVVFSDDEEVLAAVAKFLRLLAEAIEDNEKVFGSSLFESIVKVSKLHPEMSKLASECISLVLVAAGDTKMQDILSNTGALSSVSMIQELHNDIPQLMQLCDSVLIASGNAGFEHLTAKEATKQLKEAHVSGDQISLAKALSTVATLSVLDGDARGLMMEDELGTFNEVIGIVGEVMQEETIDEGVLDSAVSALDQVPMNYATVNLIAESDIVARLCHAMRQHPDNIELLLKSIRILGKMCINDKLKPKIVNSGGVDLVIQTMRRHSVSLNKYLYYALHLLIALLLIIELTHLFSFHTIPQENGPLMSACCTALANLAFNSIDTAKKIVHNGGVDAVEAVMQKNAHVDQVLARALQVLSNLMFKNDENKRLICKICGDEIVHMIRTHSDNVNVFKSGLRALGTLVYCEENCPIIIGEGATRVIVDGMRKHWSDPSVVQLALNVIENLSAENAPVSEAPDSVGKDYHPIRQGEDSLQVMKDEGAIVIISDAIQTFEQNTSIIVSSVDALLNLIENEHNLEAVVRSNGLQIVLESISSYDWDMELVQSILRLLVELGSHSPAIAINIAKLDGCEVCGAVMENFPESQEIVTNACLLLTSIANADNSILESKEGEVSLQNISKKCILSTAQFMLRPCLRFQISNKFMFMTAIFGLI